jgi:hypothetical protein
MILFSQIQESNGQSTGARNESNCEDEFFVSASTLKGLQSFATFIQ